MKRALVGAGAMLLIAAAALGQYGEIGVYTDQGGCDCNVYDSVPGNLVSVYVVHRNISQGLTGVRFVVTGGGGMMMTYLGESKVGPPMEITGNIVDGYDVRYGSCITGSLTIMEILYLGMATSATCSWLEISAAPNAVTGQVEGSDCNETVVVVSGRQTPVNPDDTCECINLSCQPVPVEETTWGGIKALYQ
jgi:hypothetical protein